MVLYYTVSLFSLYSFYTLCSKFRTESVKKYERMTKNIDPSLQSLFKEFLDYLTSPDGGNRDKIASVSVVADVNRACTIINCFNLTGLWKLFDRRTMRVEYVGYLTKSDYAADSIKKYLISLMDFCDFIVTDKIKIEEVEEGDLIQMKILFQKWKSSFNRLGRQRYWERVDEDYEMLVDPDQVKTYLESQTTVDTIKIFEQLNGREVLTQEEYCNARDHLICILHLTHGHRSGVSANLTIDEFKGARKINGDYVIKVRKHKTFSSQGYALISLPENHYTWFDKYMKYARPTSETNNFFTSTNGKAMSSGDISKRIHQLWVRAGIYEGRNLPKNLSTNIIRKSVTTGIRQASLGHLQEVADTMAHSLATAEKSYHLRNKEKTVQMGATVVRNYFFNSEDQPAKDQPAKDQPTEDQPAEEPTTPTKKSRIDRISSPKTPRSPKFNWSKPRLEILKKVFCTEIVEKSITMEKVKDLKNSWVDIGASERQVYDKVRTLTSTGLTKVSIFNLFCDNKVDKNGQKGQMAKAALSFHFMFSF